MKINLTNTVTGEAIAINKLPVIIGRDVHADVQLDDPTLQPYQAMVNKVGGGAVVVWDLHDGTATQVNGCAVLKGELRSGDTLTIGESAFILNFPGISAVPSGAHCA